MKTTPFKIYLLSRCRLLKIYTNLVSSLFHVHDCLPRLYDTILHVFMNRDEERCICRLSVVGVSSGNSTVWVGFFFSSLFAVWSVVMIASVILWNRYARRHQTPQSYAKTNVLTRFSDSTEAAEFTSSHVFYITQRNPILGRSKREAKLHLCYIYVLGAKHHPNSVPSK